MLNKGKLKFQCSCNNLPMKKHLKPDRKMNVPSCISSELYGIKVQIHN